MSEFELSEWINAAPESVFAVMTDPGWAPDVIKNVKQMEKLTDGPVRTGTRFRETRVVNGKEAQTELTVIACQPPRHYAVSTEQSGITVTYTYTLVPENGGTRVQLHANITGGGLKKLALPVVASIMRREDGNHLENLKTAVEGT